MVENESLPTALAMGCLALLDVLLETCCLCARPPHAHSSMQNGRRVVMASMSRFSKHCVTQRYRWKEYVSLPYAAARSLPSSWAFPLSFFEKQIDQTLAETRGRQQHEALQRTCLPPARRRQTSYAIQFQHLMQSSCDRFCIFKISPSSSRRKKKFSHGRSQPAS